MPSLVRSGNAPVRYVGALPDGLDFEVHVHLPPEGMFRSRSAEVLKDKVTRDGGRRPVRIKAEKGATYTGNGIRVSSPSSEEPVTASKVLPQENVFDHFIAHCRDTTVNFFTSLYGTATLWKIPLGSQ